MSKRLDGKVALVTGAGGGMGEATARLFAREGAGVVLVDNNAADLDEVTSAPDIKGSGAIGVVADLTDEDQAAAAVDAAVAEFKALHILVNTAAVRIPWAPITQVSSSAWRFIFDVNVGGVVNCSKHAIPQIAESGGGSIVHVSSIGAFGGLGGWAAYDASKAALLSLTRDMACEVAEMNIRVNAICPGRTLTKYHVRNLARESGLTYSEAETKLRSLGARNLLKRQADPEELARAILFFASEDSSFVTGTFLRVDGGEADAWEGNIPAPPPLESVSS